MKAFTNTTLDTRPVTYKVFNVITRKARKTEAGFILTQPAGGIRNETHHSDITTAINFTDRDQRLSPKIVTNDYSHLGFVDQIIAALIIMLIVIGIFGNTISCSYFWKRRKRTIHDFLYWSISIFDILTSASNFPVVTSLLNGRAPMLFDNSVFCTSWPIIFLFFIRVSMVLMILISITRAFAICFPLRPNRHQFQASKFALGISAYSILLFTIDMAFVFTDHNSEVKGVCYLKEVSFCTIFADQKWAKDGRLWTHLYSSALQVQLLLPCVVVFISFLVSTISLLNRKTMKTEDEKNFRRISVTIAIFTALFLICYLPGFVLQLFYFLSLFNVKIDLLGSRNFQHYGKLIIQIVLPLLNSGANPCIYLTRMPQYRKWILVTKLGILTKPTKPSSCLTTNRRGEPAPSRLVEDRLEIQLERLIESKV